MSHSFHCFHVHLVFATKHRRPLLRDRERAALHAYVTGIATSRHASIVAINSVIDHMHVLYYLPSTLHSAKVVEQIKCLSTLWLKKQDPWYQDFQWQGGYSDFAVCWRHLEDVERYIKNQQVHHRSMDFEMEFRDLHRANGCEVDPEYSWD